jgi:transposase
MAKHKALEQRSGEAAEIIKRLMESGHTIDWIAKRAQVSERTVYRWRDEGRAPHPILLEGLRKMGRRHGNQEGDE